MTGKKEGEETLVTAILALVILLGLAGGFWWLLRGGDTNLDLPPQPLPTPTEIAPRPGFLPEDAVSPPSQANVQLTIGILTDPRKYDGLANYLRSQLGDNYQVSIDGNFEISYQDAKAKIASKEWDIAFTLSPMLSIVAKDNGYSFAGVRMFPDFEPYYESALFVRADSPINSLQDLGADTTLALGDFNSASSFYMPIYDLYGKRLRINIGNRSSKIQEMVVSGEADVGAAAYSTIKNRDEFKIIHISRKIPGSGVYLSPNLTDTQREVLSAALLSAPEEIQKEANFGQSNEVDYTEFIRISRRVEQVLGCSDFTKSVVNLFCAPDSLPNSLGMASVQGKINGFSFVDGDTVVFYLIGTDGNRYQLVISRLLLNQGNFPPPPGWQNRTVVVKDSQPDDQFRLSITKIDQVLLMD